MTTTVAFQGELGAFGEEALRCHFGEAPEALAIMSFGEVFERIASGAADAGVVPIENSLHGSVLEVYDLLLQHEAVVVAEVVIPVSHCLMALPGVAIEDLVAVYSHPQALAQCASFIREHGLEPHASYNTAGAARDLAARGDRQSGVFASNRAARLYGLDVLARDAQTAASNATRFVVIAAAGTALDRGGDKATLVFTTRNVPGALHRALGVFAAFSVNLSRIESRPTRGTPWEYHFYLECERADQGAITPTFLHDVTEALAAETEQVRVLGVYASARSNRDQ